MVDLSVRNRLPEWMDQPDLDPELHRHALQGLARLNFFSNGAGVLWKAIVELAKKKPVGPLTVLDVATGSGDIPLALAHKARKARLNIQFSATDKSRFALETLQKKSRARNLPVECFESDALTGPSFPSHDVVICSLFLHHLDGGEAVTLLQRMAKAARFGLLVNDLERSWLNWHMVWVASHMLTTSPVVRLDGPRSVAGAFTREEALKLAKTAGLETALVKSRWPCRFLLSWQPA